MPVFTLNVSLSSGCITKRTSFRLVLGLLSMYWAIARHAFLEATFFGNLRNPVVRPGKAIEESFWLSSSFRHLDMYSICICNCNGYLIYINQKTSAVTFDLFEVSAISETTSLASYSASSVLFFCRRGHRFVKIKDENKPFLRHLIHISWDTRGRRIYI